MWRNFFDNHRDDCTEQAADRTLQESNNKKQLIVRDHREKTEDNTYRIKEKNNIPKWIDEYLLEKSPIK